MLSYADGRVGRIGLVSDFAMSAPKPEEFGSIGAYWSSVGWLLPVDWLGATISVRPKTLIARLAPLLPTTHSPIQPITGNGNQKAYLAEIDCEVFDLIFDQAGLSATILHRTPDQTVADFADRLDDIVESSLRDDVSLNETVREQLIWARRGQGIFRNRVLDVEPVCRITGIDKPNLLVASHIKPWRACGTVAERLNGSNGLMLAPHADFLFDRGLLGFEVDGRSIFSSQLTDQDADKLGMHIIQRPPPRPLSEASQVFLHHHRLNVFIP